MINDWFWFMLLVMNILGIEVLKLLLWVMFLCLVNFILRVVNRFVCFGLMKFIVSNIRLVLSLKLEFLILMNLLFSMFILCVCSVFMCLFVLMNVLVLIENICLLFFLCVVDI